MLGVPGAWQDSNDRTKDIITPNKIRSFIQCIKSKDVKIDQKKGALHCYSAPLKKNNY